MATNLSKGDSQVEFPFVVCDLLPFNFSDGPWVCILACLPNDDKWMILVVTFFKIIENEVEGRIIES